MSSPLEHLSATSKATIDALSMLNVAGTLAQLLPHAAALLTIVWTLIRLYESETMQKILRAIGRGTVWIWRRCRAILRGDAA